ncbi:MAG: PEP-CTERM sorting domain-containing protein [Pirellulales bacterium]
MRLIGTILGTLLLLLSVGRSSPGDSATYQFDELVGAPIAVPWNPPLLFPFNHGAVFDHISNITFSISGQMSSHSWLLCDVSGGCSDTPHVFDTWGISVYKPGPNGSAGAYFEADSTISLDLPLRVPGGGTNWENLESGELSLNIRPIPEGAILGIYYWQLISPPVVTLSEAQVTFEGTISSLGMPDYNGDGFVSAADYTVWRNTLGATGTGLPADGDGNHTVDFRDYNRWKSYLAQNGGGGASLSSSAVPEPATLGMIAVGVLAMLCGRWRATARRAR